MNRLAVLHAVLPAVLETTGRWRATHTTRSGGLSFPGPQIPDQKLLRPVKKNPVSQAKLLVRMMSFFPYARFPMSNGLRLSFSAGAIILVPAGNGLHHEAVDEVICSLKILSIKTWEKSLSTQRGEQ